MSDKLFKLVGFAVLALALSGFASALAVDDVDYSDSGVGCVDDCLDD